MDEVSDIVKDFLLRHIDSVAELEGLLLIRASPNNPWRAGELAQRLYISELAAEQVLSALTRRRLLSKDEAGFWYAPQSDEIKSVVDALSESYPKFLLPITHLIHAKPQSALRQFADAFRLREDK